MTKREETVEAEIVEEIQTKDKKDHKGMNSRIFWGLILVFLGIMFFLQNYLKIDLWDTFWPFLLVFVGLLLIIKGGRK